MSEVFDTLRNANGPDLDAARPLGPGAPDGRPYRVYRSRSGASWLISPGKAGRAAAAALYSPQSVPGELLRMAMRVGRIPTERVRLDSDAVDELADRLAAAAGLVTAELAFMVGPPRPGNKVVVAVMGPGSRAVAFAKVAPSPTAQEGVATEGAALELLSQTRLADGVPAILDRFAWRGCEVLVLTPGPTARGPKQPGRLHTDFLARLHEATGSSSPFGQSAAGVALEAATRSSLLRGEERARYERVASRLHAAFGTSSLPTALAHRDFVPWNTRRTRTSLWVLDWESARPNDLLLLDVFHLGFVRAALMGRPEPDRWIAAAVRRLWPEAASVLEELKLAYLADVSWQYAGKTGESRYPRDNPILASAWAAIDRQLRGSPG